MCEKPFATPFGMHRHQVDRRIKVADNLTIDVDNGHGHTEDITGSGLTNLASTRTRCSVETSPPFEGIPVGGTLLRVVGVTAVGTNHRATRRHPTVDAEEWTEAGRH